MSGLAAAGIVAGASLLGTAGNISATGKMNKKNRQWQEDMWNKTNAYNHPVSQMQRFKDAGLNPHLMYDKGDHGGTSMPTPPKQEVADHNFGDAALAYVSTRKQQAEIDNLKKANEVMEADKLQKAAQTASLYSNSAKTDQDRKQAEELFDTVKMQAEANLSQTNAHVKKIGQETEAVIKQMAVQDSQIRLSNAQIAKLGRDMEVAAATIAHLKTQNEYQKAETERVKIENRLRNLGINPNAPPLQKLLFDIVDPMIDDVRRGVKDFQRDPKRTFMRPLKPWQK